MSSIQNSRGFVIWRGKLAAEGVELHDIHEDVTSLLCTAKYREDSDDGSFERIEDLHVERDRDEPYGIKVYICRDADDLIQELSESPEPVASSDSENDGPDM